MAIRFIPLLLRDSTGSSQTCRYFLAKEELCGMGNTTPLCPGGGTYNYQVIGTSPTCNIAAPTAHHLGN